MTFNDLSKPCPYCKKINKPYEAEVKDNQDILYRYLCDRCKWPYTGLIRSSRSKVGPLVGFTRSRKDARAERR